MDWEYILGFVVVTAGVLLLAIGIGVLVGIGAWAALETVFYLL